MLLPPLINVKQNLGQSLIELMVAIGLCAILLPALITGLISFQQGKPQQQQRSLALSYLKQTEEQLRNIKDNNWSLLTPLNSDLHPALTGTALSLVSGYDTTSDGFSRKVVLSTVYRDSSNNIISVGTSSQIDPSTLLANITVTWDKPRSSSVSSTIYLTRHLDSTHSETSITDFGVGVTLGTQTTSSSGGEIILGPGQSVNAKWCAPSFANVSVDLPEVPTAVSASPGNIYVGMGNSRSAAASFAHVKVTTGPLSFTLDGRLNGGYHATSVFGEPNWGYFTTDLTNGKRLVIVNLTRFDSSGIFHEEGSFSLTSSANSDPATAIFVLNNRGYLAVGDYLYVLDLSNHAAPIQIGNRIQFSDNTFGGTSYAKEIYVRQVGSSTYAFIAINGSFLSEMVILDVTNNNNSSQWGLAGGGKVQLGSVTSGGVDLNPITNFCNISTTSTMGVYVKPDGTRAYISAASTSGTEKNFVVIDTTNKANPTVVGGVATQPSCSNGGGWNSGGMNPRQSVITLPLENRAIVVGTGGPQQYAVLDLSNESAPSMCGSLAYSGGLNGLASTQEASGEVFAYIITTTASQGLKVVQGGPDLPNGLYVGTGTFESGTFDANSSVVFNRILPSVSLPTNTNVKFQVAATDAISNSCNGATYNYIGPDGTSASFFPSSGGIIPLSQSGAFKNPARCFRYKAFLTTTDTNSTPVVNSVTVNFSL